MKNKPNFKIYVVKNFNLRNEFWHYNSGYRFFPKTKTNCFIKA